MAELVVARPQGLYCVPGDFYIDAWQPVERCIVTHVHADHAHAGHQKYLASKESGPLLKKRLGDIAADLLEYGEQIIHNGVAISLHPAGHILGSAQARLEYQGEVWIVSGDYKLEADATCTPFEPVRCHTFITESTFGLPIYRWQKQSSIFSEINSWWQRNAAQGRCSVLFCYALGKAQRIVKGIDTGIGPIITHGAVEKINEAYRQAGLALPATHNVADLPKQDFRHALVLAPPSANKSPWLKRFGDYSDAFASGWMLLRGARRRRAIDRGFVLSDHADWPGLMQAIETTGASRVIVTHGQVPAVVRWLNQKGLQASSFATEYRGEEDIQDSTAAMESGEESDA